MQGNVDSKEVEYVVEGGFKHMRINEDYIGEHLTLEQKVHNMTLVLSEPA